MHYLYHLTLNMCGFDYLPLFNLFRFQCGLMLSIDVAMHDAGEWAEMLREAHERHHSEMHISTNPGVGFTLYAHESHAGGTTMPKSVECHGCLRMQ